MYKIKEFEYDLWTTQDGRKWARIKKTGEVCEIDEKTMKALRSFEKSVYRDSKIKNYLESDDPDERIKASIYYPYSIDAYMDENGEEAACLESSFNLEKYVIDHQMEDEFMKCLTDYQKKVYVDILKNGEIKAAFSRKNNVSQASVKNVIKKIQKKAEKFFEKGV